MRWLILILTLAVTTPAVACPKCGPKCKGNCGCGCGDCGRPRSTPGMPPAPPEPPRQETVKPQIYLFFQKNCPPCYAFKVELPSVWEELKRRYQVFVVDIEQYEEFTKQQGVETVPYFKDSFGRVWGEGYLAGEIDEFLDYFSGQRPTGTPAPYVRPDKDEPPAPPAEPSLPPAPPAEDPKVSELEKQVAELNRQVAELKANPPAGPKGDKGEKGDRGDAGPAGEPGKPGESPVVDYRAIFVRIMKEFELKVEDVRCKCLTGDCHCRAELEERIAELEEAISNNGRVMYFTSRGLARTKATDVLARELKGRGKPVTIVTLNPKHIEEGNVRDVPRVFVPASGRTIVGVDDVTKFLSQLKE